ncbi:hypothetical protein C2G38_2067165 [Gigaspora rosea]|uniref:Uncharacterized protein n=1 Tax=Gigaspora rosea TaxID=44941 RepID=A0A397VW34_9GLOM|nr:hypothetical protein C2G38_2067165 [Gigaspora rosea]
MYARVFFFTYTFTVYFNIPAFKKFVKVLIINALHTIFMLGVIFVLSYYSVTN